MGRPTPLGDLQSLTGMEPSRSWPNRHPNGIGRAMRDRDGPAGRPARCSADRPAPFNPRRWTASPGPLSIFVPRCAPKASSACSIASSKESAGPPIIGWSSSFSPYMHQLTGQEHGGPGEVGISRLHHQQLDLAAVGHGTSLVSLHARMATGDPKTERQRSAGSRSPHSLTHAQAGKVLEELSPAAIVRAPAVQDGHQLSPVARNSRAVPNRSVLACQLISAL